MDGMHMFMLGIGSVAALCGLLTGIQRVRTVVSGLAVDGVVVGNEEVSTHSNRGRITRIFAPAVTFEHAGRKIRFRSSLGQAEKLSVGSHVRVRFLPADPAGSAEIDAVANFWGFPVVALLAGAAFAGVALWDAGVLPR